MLPFEFLGDIATLRLVEIHSRPYFSTYIVEDVEHNTVEYHAIGMQFTIPSLGMRVLKYDPASDTCRISVKQTRVTEEVSADHPLARYIRLLVKKDLVREEAFEYILSPADKAKIKEEDRNLYGRVSSSGLIDPETMENVNEEYLEYMESIRSIWEEIRDEHIQTTTQASS